MYMGGPVTACPVVSQSTVSVAAYTWQSCAELFHHVLNCVTPQYLYTSVKDGVHT